MTLLDAVSRLLHTGKKPGIILESIVEPIVLRLKADQNPGRFPMPGNDHLLFLSDMEVPRRVILDFGESNLVVQRKQMRY
jgi:hypothetical protein